MVVDHLLRVQVNLLGELYDGEVVVESESIKILVLAERTHRNAL